MAAELQVFLSFLGALRAQDFASGGLGLLRIVTTLFTDMAENFPFSVVVVHALFPGIRNLPQTGMEPMSPALAGGFLSTVPGKSSVSFLKMIILQSLTGRL